MESDEGSSATLNTTEDLEAGGVKPLDSQVLDLSIFDDTSRITKAFDQAVREALLDHKRAGNSVAIWRDGKVVIVPPEEIEVGP